MKSRTGQTYDTHFELAEQLGKTPEQVKRIAVGAQLGPYGSSGGVIYFPRDRKSMNFFEQIMRARCSAYFPSSES